MQEEKQFKSSGYWVKMDSSSKFPKYTFIWITKAVVKNKQMGLNAHTLDLLK